MLEFFGKKFGDWTALRTIKIDARNYLFCECVCGKVKPVRIHHLVNGNSTGCGCKRAEKVSKKQKGKRNKNLLPEGLSAKKRLYKRYIKDASTRSYAFDISFEDFLSLTAQNCFYCGSVPNNKIKARGSISEYTYNGLDRKNNFLGYTLDNCVTCCKNCNIAKGSKTEKEFLDWIKKVYENKYQ